MVTAQRGWFADTGEGQPDGGWRWQPCLQLDGVCLSFTVWFATEQQCLPFIAEEIIGRGLLPAGRLGPDDKPSTLPASL